MARPIGTVSNVICIHLLKMKYNQSITFPYDKELDKSIKGILSNLAKRHNFKVKTHITETEITVTKLRREQ